MPFPNNLFEQSMIHDTLRATKRALGYMPFAGALALGAACGDDPTSADPGDADIRFVNAAPGTASVDVFWAGQESFSAVPFGAAAAAGQYKTLAAGSQDLVVATAGASSALTSGTITTAEDRRYTVSLVRVGPSYTVAVLRDTAATPAAGKAKLRVVHFSQLAEGSVDVYVTAAGVDLATSTPTLSGLQFLKDMPYLELAAGSYQVRVTQSGSKTVILDTDSIELADGKVVTVFALDPGVDVFPLKLLTMADN